MTRIADHVLSPYSLYEGEGERLVGIEIEVEGCAPHTCEWAQRSPYWNPVPDGSLREAGMEFVSEPLDGNTLPLALPQFFEAYRRHGYVSNTRTGIHVHIDVRDLEIANVGGIVATYAVVEPILMQYVGTDREENIYCVPYYRAYGDLELVCDMLEQDNPDYIRDTCKYSALYLQPLLRFGTLEFRHAPTWGNMEQLTMWIELIRKVVAYGSSRTATEVVEETTRCSGEEFARLVFTDLYNDVRRECAVDVDTLLDVCDSYLCAEMLLPCTYKVEAGWATTALEVEGDSRRRYYLEAHSRMNDFAFPEISYGEEYHDEDPFYEEGDDY